MGTGVGQFMIVQCPSCAARYRIDAGNIPQQGGKIRCPSCSTAFVVYPSQESAPDSTSVVSDVELDRLVSQSSPLPLPDEGEDYAPTEMVSSADVDKIKALQALEDEFGAALEEDGTVEMQNPMKIWENLQKNGGAASLPAAASLPSPSSLKPLGAPTLDRDEAATEIVSADTIDIAAFNPTLSPFDDYDEDDDGEDPTEIVNVSDVLNSIQQDKENAELADTGFMSGPVSTPAHMMPSPADSPTPVMDAPNFQPTYSDKPTGEWNDTVDLSAMQFAQQNPAAQSGQQHFNAAPVQPVQQAPQLGQDPNFDGPWSLKTNFGLTYEFPDTRSLNGWLQSRDDVQGYSLSTDGTNFQPLSAFPQIMTRNAGASGSFNLNVSSTGPLGQAIAEAEKQFPSNQEIQEIPQQSVGLGSPSTGALVNNEYVLPSREGSGFVKLMWGICALSALMTLVTAAQVFNVVDIVGPFQEHVLGQTPAPKPKPAPVTPPAAVKTVDDAPVVPEEVEEKRINQIVEDAKRELKKERPKSALEKLQKVVLVDPDRAEAFELMATAHDALGQTDQAEQARKKAQQLTAVAQ